ncbi:hypothetical protein ACMGDM_05225 [Sphingomonas sp. DT-51]|uniref:hypothetical protein n=1 Tax=Sphingomonas sp. DT-51 TaxID=3396165 RepID=UPI003F1CEC22
MIDLPSRPLLRLIGLLAATLILAALAYGLRLHVVGDAPAQDRGIVVVPATPQAHAIAPAAPAPASPVASPVAPVSATPPPSAADLEAMALQDEAEDRARSHARMIERAAARGVTPADAGVN